MRDSHMIIRILAVSLLFLSVAIGVESAVASAGTDARKAPSAAGEETSTGMQAVEIPEGMILIPGGEFEMGVEDGEDNPAHPVCVDPFYMDVHEVTNAEYELFCDSTGHALPEFWGLDKYHCGPGYPNHPVLGVSQVDAMAYAEWVGKRLPTEAEWEFAARGGLKGKRYPHGDEMDKTMENFKGEGTLPVGSLVPNDYGLYDMSGNVREWVLDYYDWDYYRESPRENPRGPDKEKFAVVRGGGWHAGKGCSTVHVRYGLYPTWVDINVGFRCVKDIE